MILPGKSSLNFGLKVAERRDLWRPYRSSMQGLTFHKENYGRGKRAVIQLINGICAQSPMSVIMIKC